VRAGLLYWLLLSGLSASAQNASSAASNYPFLLRLVQVGYGSHSCVLLRRDGGYHLERSHSNSVTVFEGTLPQAQVADVTGWLNNGALRQLTQKDILFPLMSPGGDQAQISIARSDHWQTLEFPDRESRAPVASSLEPLLSWLGTLHKLPARKLTEEQGRNNCLPPGEIGLKRRPAPGIQARDQAAAAPFNPAPTENSTAPAAPPPNYLMRIERNHYAGISAQRTCLIVNANGHYHGEEFAQEIGHSMTSRVYEETLSPPAISALRQLLDDPGIRQAQSNLPPDAQFSESTVWFIPRAGEVQHLQLAESFAQRQGDSWVPVYHDPRAKVVEPLERWIKTNLRLTKQTLLKDAKPDNCIAR
jgi:hypothetical protein